MIIDENTSCWQYGKSRLRDGESSKDRELKWIC